MTLGYRAAGPARLLLVAGVVTACAGQPAPPSPSPTATLVPTIQPSPAAVAANLTARFLEAIESPDVRFRATQTTSITIGEVLVTQVITNEVVGQDAHITVSVSREGAETETSEVALIDGASYARQGSGPWQPSTVAADWAGVGRVFSFIDGETMQAMGRELHGGLFVDRLALKEPVPIDQAVRDTFAMGAGEGTLQVFDLWVQPDGTPASLEAAMSFEVRSAEDAQATSVSSIIIQEFSDFGGDVVLDLPDLP